MFAQPIEWRPWTPALFEQARREKRFVLLDLEAVWCHWCHVMETTTCADAKVVALVRAHYLAARVDEDSDPPLSERYGDYGWPATIVLDGEGREIVKRRGYLPPAQMAAMLQAIVDDPTPGPSVVEAPAVEPPSEAALSAEQRARLERRFREAYDGRYGGWGSGHKFVDSTFLGLALLQAKESDSSAAAMVRKTLDAAQGLVDREWGGMDQYSATPDWRSPHFEKLLSIQADAIHAYASAYSAFGDPRDLEMARGVERYVARFLTGPEGALYTSQDADLGRLDGHKYWALPDGRRRSSGCRASTATSTRATTAGSSPRSSRFMQQAAIPSRSTTPAQPRAGSSSSARFPRAAFATARRRVRSRSICCPDNGDRAGRGRASARAGWHRRFHRAFLFRRD